MSDQSLPSSAQLRDDMREGRRLLQKRLDTLSSLCRTVIRRKKTGGDLSDPLKTMEELLDQ